jgi:hypothetical protein
MVGNDLWQFVFFFGERVALLRGALRAFVVTW